MPEYDFGCDKCGHAFRISATMKEKESLKPLCPKCKGQAKQLFRRLNVVDSMKEQPEMKDAPDEPYMPPGCGGCGGMCGF